MSLIQGMEDVITHIKNQELRIQKLEEENKKLKRRIEEDHKAVPSFLIKDLYLDATEENKKLKEENKRLKELVGSIKKETDKAK